MDRTICVFVNSMLKSPLPQDSDESDTCDLIVLGLSFKATANDIREYFETYGPLDLVELKTKDSGTVFQRPVLEFPPLCNEGRIVTTMHCLMHAQGTNRFHLCNVSLKSLPINSKGHRF